VKVSPSISAAAALILFVAGVLRDPPQLQHSVLLGSGLGAGALGAADRLAEATRGRWPGSSARPGPAGGVRPVLVASYLVLNGITVVAAAGQAA